jgi:hypothetical protein
MEVVKMNTSRVIVLSAALAAILGGCSRSERVEQTPTGATEAGSTDPAAASSPSQREATGSETPETPAGGSTDPGAASTPSQQEATEQNATPPPAD